ncbi:MAG TPA: ATP-binding protein [Lacisediminihabitans sp.]|uniref:sensor histidine kinase n=1 Tax=Lacisediminihabitans sp. TaxID=2787631 RepID=UPI002ED7F011
MAARPVVVESGQARQPHNPISRRQVETVVSRSVAVFGLVFAAQALPTVLSQMPRMNPVFGWAMAVAIFGGIVLSGVAALVRRLVFTVNGFIAIAYLIALIVWPFVALDPTAVASERPWLWLLCSVATGTAAVAFGVWVATAYVVIAPVVYGIVRMTPSGGGKGWQAAALDTAYAMILGGACLILITLLRQAAASVDAAQATALDRYAHAVRQHATEVERVQVDAIVHDSVLTTLLSAARAETPETKELATRMARNAIGHLRDAVVAAPDGDSTVSLRQLARRIVGATSTLSAPFDLRMQGIEGGAIPIQPAEAVYSAAVQAMVNSLQHAGNGPEVSHWLAIGPLAGDGIRIEVGDTGQGFDFDAVPNERLGLRVSIVERVTNAGGTVEIVSSPGHGAVIGIVWPAPAAEDVPAAKTEREVPR